MAMEDFYKLMVKKIREHPEGWLNGFRIFELYSVHGMPIPLVREICKDRGIYFDELGIRAELRCAYGWSPEKIEVMVNG